MRRRDLLAGLAATSLVHAPARAAGPAVYRRGIAAEPGTLDPQKSTSIYEEAVLRDLFEGLITYDPGGRIVPGAAESWTSSEDGLTWTFTLRSENRWSNGDPVVAEDFAAALRRALDRKTGAPYANLLYCLRGGEAVNRGGAPVESLGVEAPDARRLVVTLAQPTPYLLELLGHPASFPVHRPTLARHGDAFTRPGNLVSNGAYRLKDVVPGDRITVVSNPHYRAAAQVRIPQVEYIPTTDLAAAVRRFAAGELDSCGVPPQQFKDIQARFGSQLVVAPALDVTSLVVNTRKAPLGDRRVRQALSIAIDRGYLAEAIFSGSRLPASSLTPAGLDNARPPPEMPGQDLSPAEREEQAAALLRQAGYGPGGKPLTLEIRFTAAEEIRNMIVAIADMWKPLGVTASLVGTDFKTLSAHLSSGAPFDLALYAWQADYSDPQNFLFLVESDNTGFNHGGYANPDYDALMHEAARTVDLDRRARLLFKAEEIFLRDLPWIPLVHRRYTQLVASRLHGLKPNVRGITLSQNLWLDA
ncbi:peptide ABC transporter substrate-binding protein [Methylobacterium sp. JK268]